MELNHQVMHVNLPKKNINLILKITHLTDPQNLQL